MLLVAVEPVPPGCWPSCWRSRSTGSRPPATELAACYAAQRRGFVLARIAGGYRYQTHPDLAPYVERFANRDVSHRLSTAALETLAIVAYRQPVSRAQISALRGVNVDGVVRLLEQRGYIEAVGRAEGPGQPVLYGTTDLFLERLGLDRIDQLPPVEDFLPGARGGRRAGGAAPSRSRIGGRRRLMPGRRTTCPPRASACRRSWPGPGSAADGSATT